MTSSLSLAALSKYPYPYNSELGRLFRDGYADQPRDPCPRLRAARSAVTGRYRNSRLVGWYAAQ